MKLPKQLRVPACLLALFGPLAVSRVMAQPEPALAFEVASVRQRVIPGAGMIRRPWSSAIQCPPPLRCGISGDTFHEEAASLADLVMDAYGVKRFQVTGLPAWGDTGRDVYDIAAKIRENPAPTLAQVRRMLQTLLSERFKLRIHRETKELPVYALVVAKNGPKLNATPDACRNGASGPGAPAGGGATAFLFSWERLPEMLTQFTDRPVIDRTGLDGHYCTPDGKEALLAVTTQLTPVGRGGDVGGLSIFTTIEELGLKLEAEKGPVEILVIDGVERPSDN